VAASDREIPAVDSHARDPLPPTFSPLWPARTSPGSRPPSVPAPGTQAHLHQLTQSSPVCWRDCFTHPPTHKARCAPEATFQPTPGSTPLGAGCSSTLLPPLHSRLSIASVVRTCAFQGLPPPCVPCGEPLHWCPGFWHSLRAPEVFSGPCLYEQRPREVNS
jgi:hypothetical protein